MCLNFYCFALAFFAFCFFPFFRERRGRRFSELTFAMDNINNIQESGYFHMFKVAVVKHIQHLEAVVALKSRTTSFDNKTNKSIGSKCLYLSAKAPSEFLGKGMFSWCFFILTFTKQPQMNKNLKHFKDAVLILTCIKLFLPIILQNLLLSLNGNSENILSSRSNFVEAFSLCHWNLNGKTTQNYFKFFLLKVYLSAYAFNVT